MKKLLVILSLFVFVSCLPVPAQNNALQSKKIENVVKKDTSKTSLKNEVIESLKMESTQDSIVSILKDTEIPAKDSGWRTWVIWIIGLVVLIIGAIASNVPTKKNKWYLQIIQVILRFIAKHILVPENKSTTGENHKI